MCLYIIVSVFERNIDDGFVCLRNNTSNNKYNINGIQKIIVIIRLSIMLSFGD